MNIESVAHDVARALRQSIQDDNGFYDSENGTEIVALIRLVVRDEVRTMVKALLSGKDPDVCPQCGAGDWTDNTTCVECGIRSEL